MFDLDKPFICNREYIKAEVRKNSKFTYKNVRQDFYELLKMIPVQEHVPTYFGKPVNIDLTKCANLYDELMELLWPMTSDAEDKDFKGFLLSYASMFMAMSDYTDDELSYLYIYGTQYWDSWRDRDYVEEPEELLNWFRTGHISRRKVLQVIACFLVINIMIGDDSWLEPYIDLEEYEIGEAERLAEWAEEES